MYSQKDKSMYTDSVYST